MLVIHRDANSHCWRLFANVVTPLIYLREQACFLDMPRFAICTETSTSNFWIKLTLGEHKCLVWCPRWLLPILITHCFGGHDRLIVSILELDLSSIANFLVLDVIAERDTRNGQIWWSYSDLAIIILQKWDWHTQFCSLSFSQSLKKWSVNVVRHATSLVTGNNAGEARWLLKSRLDWPVIAAELRWQHWLVSTTSVYCNSVHWLVFIVNCTLFTS